MGGDARAIADTTFKEFKKNKYEK